MNINSHKDIGETLDEIKDLLDIKNSYSIEDGQEKHLSLKSIRFNTEYKSSYARNRILFGAPGTGKSYSVNEDKDKLIIDGGEYERVTFHPDYSYANFVGTYKPVPCKDDEGKEAITYEYIPGPFMRVLVKALQNSKTDNVKPFLLIVEEINRANVAAVFGDVFQLLDRGENEASEYSITTSNDMRAYLAKDENLGGNPNDYEKIRIPDNMFIWATMNSADQGVYPMDTAFKRRWDFKYLGIDENDSDLIGKVVTLGTSRHSRTIEWNALRKAINNSLSSYKINEDKLLGPYFLSKKIVVPSSGNEINTDIFIKAFKNKVLMYLFDDAAKQKRPSLFDGCKDTTKYSSICSDFDKKGVDIFCKEIRDKFPKTATETTESSEAEE
jgi:5-methylcytosine-specific restriction endonuclease McrBC GTP-binding regulatory subunit McrB